VQAVALLNHPHVLERNPQLQLDIMGLMLIAFTFFFRDVLEDIEEFSVLFFIKQRTIILIGFVRCVHFNSGFYLHFRSKINCVIRWWSSFELLFFCVNYC
jgi:hypothetical protein